jgi:hypothetical protein
VHRQGCRKPERAKTLTCKGTQPDLFSVIPLRKAEHETLGLATMRSEYSNTDQQQMVLQPELLVQTMHCI